jgi:hypothetical protein
MSFINFTILLNLMDSNINYYGYQLYYAPQKRLVLYSIMV